MLRNRQTNTASLRLARAPAPMAIAASVALLAGCSADIASLNGPRGFNDGGPIPQEPIGRRNAGAPLPYDNSGWGDSGPRAGAPAPLPQKPYDRVASLPPEQAPSALNPSHPFDAPKPARPAQAAPASQLKSSGVVTTPGTTIEVAPGDTLFGISKKHHVSIGAIMDLNGLKTPALKPGQKLVLPKTAHRPVVRDVAMAPSAAAGTPAPAVAAAPAPIADTPKTAEAPTAAPSDWSGNYTVKPGDSLFGIARTHKTTVAELQRVNGAIDALKMKPGTKLRVPADGTVPDAPSDAPAHAPQASAQPLPPVQAATPNNSSPLGGVHILNAPPAAVAEATQPPASVPTEPTAAQPTKVAVIGSAPVHTTGKFLWPAKGTILAGFGKRPDGVNNDGINIGVPAGTDIKAAEAGTVAYAGGEIKAYGNLVLLRHEGGWVTAYAHADSILVKRGDTIKRGQVIAKAGATGSVDQPQVHFELRQGSKPVDPAPHMDK